MTLAFSYIRFSSSRQATGASLKRQTEQIAKYVAESGVTLDKRSFKDLGVSAFRGKNVIEGELGTFLKAVDDGVIPSDSHLLVENLDRLSRNEVDLALELFLSVIRRGITIVTLGDFPQVYSTERIRQDNGVSLMMSIMFMVRAHDESVVKQSRARDGMRRKRAAYVKKRICPRWLTLSEDRTKYEEVPENVALVRRIFDLAQTGRGVRVIAQQLNEEGVPIPAAKMKVVRHDYWSAADVAHLLRNEAVIGTLTSKVGLESLPNYYPAIIDPVQYYEVRRLITEKTNVVGRTGEHVSNLFSGLLRCRCGGLIRFHNKGKNAEAYLVCRQEEVSAGCDARSIRYDAFENEALSILLFDQDEEVVPLRTVVPRDVTAPIKAELTTTRAQRDRLLDLVMNGGMASSAAVGARITEIEAKVAALEKQLLEVVVPTEDPRDAVERAMSLFIAHQEAALEDDLTRYTEIRYELQAALRRIINKVVLTDSFVKNGELYVGIDFYFVWDDEPFHFDYLRPKRRAWNKKS